jgi:hypothetical protein|tara:strand:- start:2877 stop:3089 length:213 start_codon:yes stop_codon:yes gene_type:complete
MNRYFDTLDFVAGRMPHDPSSTRGKKVLRKALTREHDAGPEANYIIRVWKEERGLEKRPPASGDVTKPHP